MTDPEYRLQGWPRKPSDRSSNGAPLPGVAPGGQPEVTGGGAGTSLVSRLNGWLHKRGFTKLLPRLGPPDGWG